MYMVLPLTQKTCPKLMTTRWQKVGFEVGGIYCIHIYIYIIHNEFTFCILILSFLLRNTISQ